MQLVSMKCDYREHAAFSRSGVGQGKIGRWIPYSPSGQQGVPGNVLLILVVEKPSRTCGWLFGSTTLLVRPDHPDRNDGGQTDSDVVTRGYGVCWSRVQATTPPPPPRISSVEILRVPRRFGARSRTATNECLVVVWPGFE